MNKVHLSGRLTKDPEVKESGNNVLTARYTLAVDRRGREGTDYINCIAWNKDAEFVRKYLKKGVKIIVTGRIQTGSFQKQDGTKVFTTDVVVEDHEFCESKKTAQQNQQQPQYQQNYAPQPQQYQQAPPQNPYPQPVYQQIPPQQNMNSYVNNVPNGVGEELPFS